MPKCVTGIKKQNDIGVSKVKTSDRVQGWHNYVGNLNIGTTKDNLLNTCGM